MPRNQKKHIFVGGMDCVRRIVDDNVISELRAKKRTTLEHYNRELFLAKRLRITLLEFRAAAREVQERMFVCDECRALYRKRPYILKRCVQNCGGEIIHTERYFSDMELLRSFSS